MAHSQGKEVLCYCHWGGERRVTDNGGFNYDGGIIDVVLIDEKTTFDQFFKDACEALCIDPSAKLFHYSCNNDDNRLIQLKDERGLRLMYHISHGTSNIFITEKGVCHNSQCNREFNAALNEPTQPIPSSSASENHTDYMNLPESLPQITSNTTSSVERVGPMHMPELNVGFTIEEGQLFESSMQFKQAVSYYAMVHKFAYAYLNNSRSYYRIICNVEGCSWKLTARCDGDSDVVRVVKIYNAHSHTTNDIAQYKPSIRTKYTGCLIKSKICNTPGYLPSDIRKDFDSSYSINLTYKQAWSAKEWAKRSITGSPSDSFKFVPWMCGRLVECIPGTHALCIVDDDNRFKYLFVAYGCSIDGFHSFCRPLVFIDACFLTAHYGGVLMSACGLDANNGLYPLAYCFTSAEDETNWLWFLQQLKYILRGRRVVLMTDRNQSLLTGIIDTFGGELNSWCLRHLKENFSNYVRSVGLKTKKKETALKLINNIAYARDQRMYQHHVEVLKKFKSELGEWVLKNGPEHWANALFPMKRWDWLSTNPAESYNAWLGPLRDLNIFQFMKDHIIKYTNFFMVKRSEVMKWSIPVGPRIEDKIREVQSNMNGLQGYSHAGQGRYTVFDRDMKRYAVDLQERLCSCFEWQMSGIPCCHAMRVIGVAGLNVYDLVDTCFRKETQQALLEFIMPPVSTNDEPTLDEIRTTVAISDITDDFEDVGPSTATTTLPPLTKRAAGRPRKKRIESQHQDKRILRCSRCNGTGHNRKNCKEPITE